MYFLQYAPVRFRQVCIGMFHNYSTIFYADSLFCRQVEQNGANQAGISGLFRYYVPGFFRVMCQDEEFFRCGECHGLVFMSKIMEFILTG